MADAYRLDAAARAQLLGIVSESIARGGESVRRRVDAGGPNFIKMWNATEYRSQFARALD